MENKPLAAAEIALDMLSPEDRQLLDEHGRLFAGLYSAYKDTHGFVPVGIEDLLCDVAFEEVPGSREADTKYANIINQLITAGSG